MFNNSVCIARYGQIFRGNKVSSPDDLPLFVFLYFQAMLAQQYGCRGLIIYSDPADYAPKGGPPTFPNGWSLPDTGIQRGTLNTLEGDVLTPNLPGIGSGYNIILILLLGNSSVRWSASSLISRCVRCRLTPVNTCSTYFLQRC